MYGAMRAYDESTTGYYGVQWKSEPYILQEDKEIKGYISPVVAYVDEIVCDVIVCDVIFKSCTNEKIFVKLYE